MQEGRTAESNRLRIEKRLQNQKLYLLELDRRH